MSCSVPSLQSAPCQGCKSFVCIKYYLSSILLQKKYQTLAFFDRNDTEGSGEQLDHKAAKIKEFRVQIQHIQEFNDNKENHFFF
jgi:hypothetical protein